MDAGSSFFQESDAPEEKAIVVYDPSRVARRLHNTKISIAHTAKKLAEIEIRSDQDIKVACGGIGRRADSQDF
jgi:hypothetical protein